ncbi:MAG: hypothetical protein V9H25_06620 [Candidatus Competibacter sp.]
MTDIFAQATKQIFSSALAKDALYTDESGNLMTVRVVQRSERKNVFDSFSAEYITIGATIEMLRPDSTDIKTKETIQIDSKIFEITNIAADDGYTVLLEVR